MEGFGTLAQLVEQRTFNPLVGGSSPPRPTKIKNEIAQLVWAFLRPRETRLQNRYVFQRSQIVATERLIDPARG